MGRINNKDLDRVLTRINEATGQPTEAWTEQDGKWRANVGSYVLDYCYGGVRLSKLTSEGGGERDITVRGTKKECYYQMLAFLAGVEAGKEG